jgi:hypothetical protein
MPHRVAVYLFLATIITKIFGVSIATVLAGMCSHSIGLGLKNKGFAINVLQKTVIDSHTPAAGSTK